MPPLKEYLAKRRFGRTPEPRGVGAAGKKSSGAASRGPKRSPAALPERTFVVQKHRASALHYDFRLASAGVLHSWAVPKGPSLDPSVKRLAMQVEDHPLEYATFEGVIPEGEYGGGTVMVWDIGTWVPDGEDDPEPSFRAGRIRFTLKGSKLKGAWALVRTRGRQWLLMKSRDRYAAAEGIAETKPRSVLSRRLLAEIARDAGGDVAKASTGDPGGTATAPRASRAPRARSGSDASARPDPPARMRPAGSNAPGERKAVRSRGSSSRPRAVRSRGSSEMSTR